MISVVVVNWNRRELLRACLASLRRQTHRDFELIVVDNGSTDGSADMAESEFGAFVIRNQRNLGFCAANNQGIAAARGEYIALLNNDAEAEPEWLASLERACSTAPGTGMAASKILVWEDPERIDKAGHLIFPDGQNRGRGAGQRDLGQFEREEDVLWPDGCAAMYRKAMLDGIGGFDEDFFAYGDDAELGLRARIAGWNCVYAPLAVVRHHRGATMGKNSAGRLQLIERNRVLLALKLFPWRLLWLNPLFFAVRLAAGAALAGRGAGDTVHFPGLSGKIAMAGALARGDLEALRLAPKILAKRREVRRLAKLTPSEITALIWRNRLKLSEVA